MADLGENEVDLNFEVFKEALPKLLQCYPGKYVLMHNAKIMEIYDTSISAVVAGLQKFGENKYSVQEVSDQSDNLGFYSYAGGVGQA